MLSVGLRHMLIDLARGERIGVHGSIESKGIPFAFCHCVSLRCNFGNAEFWVEYCFLCSAGSHPEGYVRNGVLSEGLLRVQR